MKILIFYILSYSFTAEAVLDGVNSSSTSNEVKVKKKEVPRIQEYHKKIKEEQEKALSSKGPVKYKIDKSGRMVSPYKNKFKAKDVTGVGEAFTEESYDVPWEKKKEILDGTKNGPAVCFFCFENVRGEYYILSKGRVYRSSLYVADKDDPSKWSSFEEISLNEAYLQKKTDCKFLFN